MQLSKPRRIILKPRTPSYAVRKLVLPRCRSGIIVQRGKGIEHKDSNHKYGASRKIREKLYGEKEPYMAAAALVKESEFRV